MARTKTARRQSIHPNATTGLWPSRPDPKFSKCYCTVLLGLADSGNRLRRIGAQEARPSAGWVRANAAGTLPIFRLRHVAGFWVFTFPASAVMDRLDRMAGASECVLKDNVDGDKAQGLPVTAATI